MPNRKQRRRREKLKRHEYEYLIENEEGEEVPLESPRELERKEAGKTGTKRPARTTNRRGRPIPQPSLERVLKRAAIFGPLLLVVTFITSPSLSTTQKILNAIILLAVFIPFSYVVDVMVYRAMTRRRKRQSGD